MRIGTPTPFARTRRATATPSRPGSPTSRTTTSGTCRSSATSAPPPSDADSTVYPSAPEHACEHAADRIVVVDHQDAVTGHGCSVGSHESRIFRDSSDDVAMLPCRTQAQGARMSFVRRLSTRRLIGVTALALVLVTGGVAVAQSALAAAHRRRPLPLDQAIQQAASGPAPAGITARITFTNTLIASGSLPERRVVDAASDRRDRPALGAGRRQVPPRAAERPGRHRDPRRRPERLDPRRRVEHALQASCVELRQLVVDRHGLAWAVDAREDRRRARRSSEPHVNISAANPTTVGGQGAYETTLSPKHDGGLLGGLAIAFDAARGIPLRLAITLPGRARRCSSSRSPTSPTVPSPTPT